MWIDFCGTVRRMTIICAARDSEKAWIGCDSAGTDGWGIQADHGTKLHKAKFGWLGFTGSYRTLQVIHRSLRMVESIDGLGEMEGLVNTIDGALKDAGWSRTSATGLPECKDLKLLLVSNCGNIWTIQSDLSYLKHKEFGAVGAGYQLALGAMYAARFWEMESEKMVELGIEAACAIVASCALPRVIQEVSNR